MFPSFQKGFPADSVTQNLPTNAGDTGDVGLTLDSGRPPGKGNGAPLRVSCLEDLMDRGAWWAAVTELDATEHSTQRHFRKFSSVPWEPASNSHPTPGVTTSFSIIIY